MKMFTNIDKLVILLAIVWVWFSQYIIHNGLKFDFHFDFAVQSQECNCPEHVHEIIDLEAPRVEDPTTLHPYISWEKETETIETSKQIKFRNFFDETVVMWFDNGTPELMFCGELKPHETSATSTYDGHKFIIKNKEGKTMTIIRITKNSIGYKALGKDDSDLYKKTMQEQEYLENYYKEHGTPWLAPIGRPPASTFIYPCDYLGQKFKNGNVTLTVVSTSPKVLFVKNILTSLEVEHLLEVGIPIVKRSSVGDSGRGFSSDTRTSSNGWIDHEHDTIVEGIMRKFARVLKMDWPKDRHKMEKLQFVQYKETQEYQNHHDFGVSDAGQRFSTLLIYLKTPATGGETSFPKAFNGRGIKMKADPGDAVLFYSMLPDGNGDIMSLHAGMPVGEGSEKYVVNLWSWDPSR